MSTHGRDSLKRMRRNGGAAAANQGTESRFPAKALSAEAPKRHAEEHERLAATLRRTASKPVTRIRRVLTACGNVRHFRGEEAAAIGPAATLNDTQLRKNLRRKNAARKSFLGHARRLNNLPIETAKARPTPRFAAHGGSFVGPRSAVRSSAGLEATRTNSAPAMDKDLYDLSKEN